MKITDMISVRVPVILSIRFQAITELMMETALFTNASELAGLLARADDLKSTATVRPEAANRLWDDEWTERVLPLLRFPSWTEAELTAKRMN